MTTERETKQTKPDRGRTAYEAYREHAWRASPLLGATLPPWEALYPHIQDGWRAAARAVVVALNPSRN